MSAIHLYKQYMDYSGTRDLEKLEQTTFISATTICWTSHFFFFFFRKANALEGAKVFPVFSLSS